MSEFSRSKKRRSGSQESSRKAVSSSRSIPSRSMTYSSTLRAEKGTNELLNEEITVQKRNRFSQILAAILVNSVYEMRNYPIVLINTVLSPLSFLLVIVFVSRGSLIGQAVEGGFIMSMFSAGVGLQADLSHLKNDFKLQDMVVSSPTTWLTYMLGMA